MTKAQDRWFRQAGTLIIAGLLVEVVTIAWPHPTAFIVFTAAGVTLVVAGVARYAWALIGTPR